MQRSPKLDTDWNSRFINDHIPTYNVLRDRHAEGYKHTMEKKKDRLAYKVRLKATAPYPQSMKTALPGSFARTRSRPPEDKFTMAYLPGPSKQFTSVVPNPRRLTSPGN